MHLLLYLLRQPLTPAIPQVWISEQHTYNEATNEITVTWALHSSVALAADRQRPERQRRRPPLAGLFCSEYVGLTLGRNDAHLLAPSDLAALPELRYVETFTT